MVQDGTVTADSPWRSIGDTTPAEYAKQFQRFGSPMSPDRCFAAASPHSAVLLWISEVEQKHFTYPSPIPKSFNNPLSLAKPGASSDDGIARWEQFPTPEAGFRACRDRITSQAYGGGIYADTESLKDLVWIYAPPEDNNDSAAYLARGVALINAMESPGGGSIPEMATKPRVLITRGHGTLGDSGAVAGGISEEVQNKRIAPAIADALRGAGYHVTIYPNPLTSDAAGNLDTEGMFARNWMIGLGGKPGVMIDVHLESSAASGMFAIIADDAGLITGAVGAQPATDVWANNVGDRRLGLAICEEVNRRTGIPIRGGWLKSYGLMSETQTFVGSGGGGQYPPSRLAMYGYTAEFHQSVYRLVVEFGALQNDAEFFGASTFPAKAAAGVVAAFAREFGSAPAPSTTTTRAPVRPGPTYPEGMDKDLAASLFGRVVTEDLSTGVPEQKVWQYTEGRSVSNLWLAEGSRVGVFPRLISRDLFDEREYFTFANGSVIWRPNKRSTFRVLRS